MITRETRYLELRTVILTTSGRERLGISILIGVREMAMEALHYLCKRPRRSYLIVLMICVDHTLCRAFT